MFHPVAAAHAGMHAETAVLQTAGRAAAAGAAEQPGAPAAAALLLTACRRSLLPHLQPSRPHQQGVPKKKLYHQ